MKKIITIIVLIVGIFTLMFAEHSYIMVNLKPYSKKEETIYIEIFGQIDEYYAGTFSEIE